MNSLRELRDYAIADTIQRIQSMTQEELIQTLVYICTEPFEKMSADEIFQYRQKFIVCQKN